MKKEFFVLAHNIRSLHNVGSIFRTADVFAVDKLFLSGYTGKPPSEKLAKVSLGTENTVPWEYGKSAARLITKLRKQYPKLVVVGLENNLKGLKGGKGKKGARGPVLAQLQHFVPQFPTLLVLGEEVSGIPKNVLKLCDSFVEIPQLGKKESLNVSIAFGIAAYALRFGK